MADRIEDLSWVYETPNVEVKGYEEMPSPPGGAARWGETVETPARTGELKASSPEYYPEGVWNQAKEIGRRLGATIGWAKNKAKQNLAYGAEALAGNDTDTLNEIVPANTQGWWDYYTKKQDYDSDKDMPYSAYVSPAVKPSDEYAGFTDTVLYNDTLDPDKAQPGKVGRAIGDFINRLGGNFESTDKEDELAYKKGLATLQGAQGYMADTLPEQIEALVGELGLRGAMATLGPAFVEARKLREEANAATKAAEDAYVRDPLYTSTPTHEMSPAHEAAYNFAVDKRYDAAKAADRIKKELAANAAGRRYAQNYSFPADVKQKLTTDQYHNLMTKVGEIANKHEQVARAMRETDNLDEFNRLKGVLRDLEYRANQILPGEAIETHDWLRRGSADGYKLLHPDLAEARQLAEDIRNAEFDGSDNRATRLLKDIWGL